MEKSIEFSTFFRALNSAKDGNKESKENLDKLLLTYESKESSTSPLEELGHMFITIGIQELYKYAGSTDICFIGNIDLEGWEKLSEGNDNQDLPNFLANAMVSTAKKEEISKNLALKWDAKRREIDKNIQLMARYITEGILDSIE